MIKVLKMQANAVHVVTTRSNSMSEPPSNSQTPRVSTPADGDGGRGGGGAAPGARGASAVGLDNPREGGLNMPWDETTLRDEILLETSDRNAGNELLGEILRFYTKMRGPLFNEMEIPTYIHLYKKLQKSLDDFDLHAADGNL